METVKRKVRFVIQWQSVRTGEWHDERLEKARDIRRAREILANYRRDMMKLSCPLRIVRRETVRTDTPVK